MILAPWKASLERLVEVSQEESIHLKLTAVKPNSYIFSQSRPPPQKKKKSQMLRVSVNH